MAPFPAAPVSQFDRRMLDKLQATETEESIWGGSWEKVHNVKIFNLCFFTDSYGRFNEETSVENRLKKYRGITKLRHFCDTRLHAYL